MQAIRLCNPCARQALIRCSISETLAKGEKIQLVGFGTFEVRERAAREGVNPRTGDKIKIAASKVPAFKAGSALKDAVAK